MQSNASGLTTINKSLEGGRRVPIERAHGLTPAIFYERYLTGIGKPVIVTDELNTWPARSKWNLEFFKSRYGSDSVIASVWPGNKYMKVIKLDDYISYVQAPNDRPRAFGLTLKPNSHGRSHLNRCPVLCISTGGAASFCTPNCWTTSNKALSLSKTGFRCCLRLFAKF